jgi:hypothetical protein
MFQDDHKQGRSSPFGFLAGKLLSIFEPDDAEVIASQMPNNSVAGLLLLEDRWAIPLFIKGSHLERRGRSQGWRPSTLRRKSARSLNG